MKKTLLFLFLAASFMEGCVAVRFRDITSYVPAGVHYQKIIVQSDFSDVPTRQMIEDAVVHSLQQNSVGAQADYQVFDPKVQYTDDDRTQTIQRLGFDAALSVQIIDTKVYQTHSHAGPGAPPPPQTYATNFVSVTMARFKIQTNLYDTKDFSPVWTANISDKEVINNPSEASFDQTLADAFADKLVGELQDEGVVAMPPK